MRKPRKHYASAEKVSLLRRHVIDRVPVSDLCYEYPSHRSISKPIDV